KDYHPTLELLKRNESIPEEWGSYLALKAFSMVSAYDAVIADYFDKMESTRAINIAIPNHFNLSCLHTINLRYGENPHQQAGFYTCNKKGGWSLIHGKELSFNNLMDMDAGFRAIRLYSEPTVMILKHTNPCGVGSAFTLSEAYRNAFNTDTISPFGGIVVVNRNLDLETAILINKTFTEIIIAPGFQDGVLEVLQKKKDRRLIQYTPGWLEKPANALQLRTLFWGYLMQQWDLVNDDISTWRVVSSRQPSQYEFDAMIFGWKCVAVLKSNAIALTTDDRTLGLGIGQTSRIDSTDIALMKAKKFGHDLSKAVCASDGFFPFRDSIDELYQNGIRAVIQPGGSRGDEEVIQACNELDIAMVFTGVRHFKH
ncbi:MAG: bifunctional phosphoribosylaminoimidazolecarboxamide formyltransferase/IMP cyclohydrolase, partial [Candidatus Cloacimonadaceae bacterium]|nr:bifunctional phosphoribosylaminoimidazolecarboxamide formyltransferase/IMP cyclohydrolase [Candidatus Cloacimonadaceae bacterium]